MKQLVLLWDILKRKKQINGSMKCTNTIFTRTKMRGSFTSLSKAGSLLSIGGRERRKGSKVSDMARRVRSLLLSNKL